MKTKGLAILILTVIMALSLVACASGTGGEGSVSEPSAQTGTAAGQPDGTVPGNQDNSTPGNDQTSETAQTDNGGTSAPEIAGETLSTAYADLMKSGNYYMKYAVEMDMAGEKIESKIEAAYNSEGYAMTTEMNTGGVAVRTRMIIKGDTMYIIDDGAKSVMEMPVAANPSASNDNTDYSGLQYLGKGTDTLRGKTLTYEEYESSGVTLRYYFDGKDLYAMESKMGSVSTLMIIEALSDKIPPGIFDIPAGYEIITIPQF